jgi:hypothetical protein
MMDENFRSACAAMAMQALIGRMDERRGEAIAAAAFNIADAMVAEMEKRNLARKAGVATSRFVGS